MCLPRVLCTWGLLLFHKIIQESSKRWLKQGNKHRSIDKNHTISDINSTFQTLPNLNRYLSMSNSTYIEKGLGKEACKVYEIELNNTHMWN